MGEAERVQPGEVAAARGPRQQRSVKVELVHPLQVEHFVLHDRSEQLESDGFVTIDSYLDPESIQSLLTGFQVVNGAATRTRRGVAFAQRNLLAAPFVRAFVEGGSVRNLLESIAPDVIPVRAILFDKTGDANWTVPWHQDRSIAVRERREVAGFGPWSVKAGVTHVQPPVEMLRQMVTLRFSLDSCGKDNGPLRAIAGTHLRVLSADEVEAVVATQEEQLCTTAAGGVVIMRPLLLHASSPAKEVNHRRVLHIEFGPERLPGGLEWAWT
jgi:hypothetical protein